MSERGLLRIPQPQAVPGDEVSVENYRAKPPTWEHGECTSAQFHVAHGGAGGRWRYCVRLHRRSPRDHAMHRTVDDSQIERYL